MEVIWSDLAVYSGHGIYDAKYTSLVADEQMVIRHLLIAPNRIYYLVDADKVIYYGHCSCKAISKNRYFNDQTILRAL